MVKETKTPTTELEGPNCFHWKQSNLDSSPNLNIAFKSKPSRHIRRREKCFGEGKPRPLSRNIKLRIMALARVLMRATEPGKHYGQITAKHLAVLSALLWGFHNAHSGLCFPSLDSIAERAGCCRRTVATAIKALEAAGILSWVNRIKRVCGRVLRTSNGYWFNVPPEVQRTECKLSSRTAGQESFSNLCSVHKSPAVADFALYAALMRLKKAVRTPPSGGGTQWE